jgi:hypothetical protein
MCFIWPTRVSYYGVKKMDTHKTLLFVSSPNSLLSYENRRASSDLPALLSHGPRICVPYFPAVTRFCVSCVSFVKVGNMEGVPRKLSGVTLLHSLTSALLGCSAKRLLTAV